MNGDQSYGILCCLCGVPIEPNPTSMCLPCLRTQVNITEGIDEEQTLLACHQCGRYNIGNDKYVPAPLESPQLLGICLKKIHGLKDVRVVDAGFVWTEEHSKKIKVRLIIQKEIQHGAVLQQEHICTFNVITTMCTPCQYTYTDHTWSTRVQVRQRVSHKRTFLYLEQLLLKHRAKLNITNIREYPEGLDFYFSSRSDAGRFVDLLHSVVPGTHSESQKLISADLKSNTATIEYSVVFEIVPLCRDDLVYLPQRFYNKLGGIGPLCIVSRVNNAIHFVDPLTGHGGMITPQQYFSCPFKALMDRRHKQEAIVLVTEPVEPGSTLAYVECQREADMYEGRTVTTRTFQPTLCQPGRSIAVYSIDSLDFNDLGTTVPATYNNMAVLIAGRWKEKKSQRRPIKKPVARLETDEGVAVVEVSDAELNDAIEEMEEDGLFETELAMLQANMEAFTLTGPAPAAGGGLEYAAAIPLTGIEYQGYCPQ